MSINRIRKLENDQRGMASFLITMIMTIVITLIVIGFSQIARNEQTTALNRELSTQAFYAAESGINDAISAIQAYEAENTSSLLIVSPPNKTTCSDKDSSADPTVAEDYPTLGGTVNQPLNINYPCVIISANPTSLVYTGATDQVINIQTQQDAVLNSITINWQNDNATNVFDCDGTIGNFPATWPNNCDADVLQVDIVPASALASDAPMSNLESDTFTTFLYPNTTSADQVTDTPNSNGVVQGADCTNSGCTAVISVNALDQNQFYMRINAMYGTPQNITITGTDNNGTVAFVNGQALIDSTGIANGVERRIEVRAPINSLNNGIFPNAAIQSTQTVCKKFWITPTGTAGSTLNPTPGSIINAAPTVCSTD